MSTTASAQSPTILRSQSTSKQPPTYAPPPDSPSRTRSTTSRPTNTNQRSASGLYRVERPPVPPVANQATLANVARRDVEDPNLAQSPSGRRSTSKDRYYENRPQAHRTESSGSQHHRNSSRHGSRRPSTEMAVPPTSTATNGTSPAPTSTIDRPTTASNQTPRRRTTITTQTGTWLLGKTIGQGSMGKVKLGKNLETGEQVSLGAGKELTII